MSTRELYRFFLRSVFFSPRVNHGLALLGPLVLLMFVGGDMSRHAALAAMFAVSATPWWVSSALRTSRRDRAASLVSGIDPAILMLPVERTGVLRAWLRAHRTYSLAVLLLLTAMGSMLGKVPSDAKLVAVDLPGGATVHIHEWYRTYFDEELRQMVTERHTRVARSSLIFDGLKAVPFLVVVFGLYFLCYSLATSRRWSAGELELGPRHTNGIRFLHAVHALLALVLILDVFLPQPTIERILGVVGS